MVANKTVGALSRDWGITTAHIRPLALECLTDQVDCGLLFLSLFFFFLLVRYTKLSMMLFMKSVMRLSCLDQ